jgi:hypothetical protein
MFEAGGPPHFSEPPMAITRASPHAHSGRTRAVVASSLVLRVLICRSPIVRRLLVLALLVLAIVLLWHLIGMDHSEGMGLLSTCLFLLVAALALAAQDAAWRFRPAGAAPPQHPWVAPVEPVPRRPPDDGPLEGVVLVC